MSRVVEVRKMLAALSFKGKGCSQRDLKFYEAVLGKNADYGKDEKFLYLKSADIKRVAKKYGDLGLSELQELIQCEHNEERALALAILVSKYNAKRAESREKSELCDFFLANTAHVNNWNLVDTSAHHILGAHVYHKLADDQVLLKLAASDSLWEKRIAMVSTLYLIRKNEFKLTVQLAQVLLNDEHDLIHKAVGWMLREVGKRDKNCLVSFLDEHSGRMPRVMLRYAIEKLSPTERKLYMSKRN